MLESIYVGVTGLVGFSRDLSVIGNNVANLNTAGFKASQLMFSDLFYRTQYSGEGADGVPGRLFFRGSPPISSNVAGEASFR